MDTYKTIRKWSVIIITTFMFINCGGGSGAGTDSNSAGNGTGTDTSSYKGLQFYHQNMPASDYKLNQLTDSEFDELDETKQLAIANKLLATLFFGYPLKDPRW